MFFLSFVGFNLLLWHFPDGELFWGFAAAFGCAVVWSMLASLIDADPPRLILMTSGALQVQAIADCAGFLEFGTVWQFAFALGGCIFAAALDLEEFQDWMAEKLLFVTFLAALAGIGRFFSAVAQQPTSGDWHTEGSEISTAVDLLSLAAAVGLLLVSTHFHRPPGVWSPTFAAQREFILSVATFSLSSTLAILDGLMHAIC